MNNTEREIIESNSRSSSSTTSAKFKKGKKKGKFNFKKGFKTTPSGKPNDVAWYSRNEILLKIAGLVNFIASIAGNAIAYLNEWVTDKISVYTLNRSIPGVLRLSWIPTPGKSTDGNSPINKCANEFFQILRLKNFSLSAYDSADVMFYLLACDSVFSIFAWMTLVYAHLRKWEFTNNYYPKAILRALHVDFDDISNKMDQFLFYINEVQWAINDKLRVPKSFYYTNRHMHMSAQIYKDSNLAKAQLYVFTPAYLLKYDATQPALVPVNIGNSPNPLKLDDIKTIVNDMLARIIPDEDFQIIAADIEKYFGGECHKVNSLDWSTTLEPVYNEEMMWQIHNANMMEVNSINNNSITQEVDANLNTIIKFDPEMESDAPGLLANRIIDSENEIPDAKEVVESTRFMFSISDITKSTTVRGRFTFKLDSVGSEILIGCKIYQYDNAQQLQEYPITTFVKCGTIADASSPSGYSITFPWVGDITKLEPGTDFRSLVDLAPFNKKPIVYYGFLGGDPDDWKYMPGGIVAPLDNYAVLENEQLKGLNLQSLLSMLAIKSV